MALTPGAPQNLRACRDPSAPSSEPVASARPFQPCSDRSPSPKTQLADHSFHDPFHHSSWDPGGTYTNQPSLCQGLGYHWLPPLLLCWAGTSQMRDPPPPTPAPGPAPEKHVPNQPPGPAPPGAQSLSATQRAPRTASVHGAHACSRATSVTFIPRLRNWKTLCMVYLTLEAWSSRRRTRNCSLLNTVSQSRRYTAYRPTWSLT